MSSMVSKKYQVFVKPSVNRRLAVHIAFLARVSESAAVRLYKAYEESLGFIGDYPQSCPIYTSNTPIDAELRYKLFYERYKIVFEIILSTIKEFLSIS